MPSPPRSSLYDVFVCHASEDKKGFVRPLAKKLREHHIEVWYDEFSLRPGDSLRRSIDVGLKHSRYGLVVLSPAFFQKGWTQWELDGLVQREINADAKTIIPIWHRVDREDVAAYSLPLADKVAIKSSRVSKVISDVLRVIRPEGSTLLVARDLLLDFGADPPVVTDDWWLDVAEASAANPMEGDFQESMGWGHWGFPLPPKSKEPQERGERLAWAAMQMMWQEAAERARVSQLSHPDEVWSYIQSNPGLWETCQDYPIHLLAYAPQIGIPGFGGELELVFDAMLEDSMKDAEEERNLTNDKSGSAMTTTGRSPKCDMWLAIRHPTFGDFEPASLACEYVQGDALCGPRSRCFPHMDYVAWFLSDKSSWMPLKHHQFLLAGMREWAVWNWNGRERELISLGFEANQATGALWDAMTGLRERSESEVRGDIESRLAFSSQLLGLPESGEELAVRFMKGGFIEAWKEREDRRMQR